MDRLAVFRISGRVADAVVEFPVTFCENQRPKGIVGSVIKMEIVSCWIGNIELGEIPGLPLKSSRKLTASYRRQEQNGVAGEQKGRESVATGVRMKISQGTLIPGDRIPFFDGHFPCLKQCVPKAPYHSPVRCRVC